MAHGGRTSVRTKLGTIAVLTAGFSIIVAAAGAVVVTGDPLGARTGLEVEGNQAHEVATKLDWQDLAGLTPASDGDSLTLISDDTLDSGLLGSSKENDPSAWVCSTGGDSPGKANILEAAVNIRTAGVGGPFLDLAFVREAGLGDSHVNFEFNQQAIASPCPNTGRSTGDLLVSVDFPGGSGSAVVEVFLWDSTVSADGQWIGETTFPAAKAAAASNGADASATNVITDYLFGLGTIDTREFGEASIDLSAVFGTEQVRCVRFGEVNIRSRSSGESLSSALQDRLPPTRIDLSTCGTVVVHKVDDAANPLAGATFGLWAADATVPAVDGGTRPSTDAIDTCTSLADGSCTFFVVDPGDYQVAELTPRAGYAIDPTVVEVTVGHRETVDVKAAFVDPLLTGYVQIIKAVTDNGQPIEVAASDLKGLTFILEKDGEPVSTWPPPGSPAECSLDGLDLSCEIGPVPPGSYTVTEDPSTLPARMGQGPDMPVTISAGRQTEPVTITNQLDPIAIDLDKTGALVAHVGDVVTYEFTATNAGDSDLLNVELTDATCDAGTIVVVTDGDGDATLLAGAWDAVLEAFVGGEAWTYTCERTLAEEDIVIVDDRSVVLNTGEVRGEDARRREVTATDSHVVQVISPVIHLVKTVDDDSPAVGQTVTFTYVVTNAGDTTLFEVSVVDDRLGEVGTLAKLAPAESKVLTKTMVVAANSPIRNVATATGADVLGKRVSAQDDATIAIVLGVVLVRPAPQPALAATGSDVTRLIPVAVGLLMIGCLLVLSDAGVSPARRLRRRPR